jgi:hypothetical protein
MAEALATHVSLMGAYIVKVEEGEDQYLGEIAGKLRLLVLKKGANKPLLIRVAALSGYELTYRYGDTPGIEDGPQPFEEIAFDTWLKRTAAIIQTESSAPGHVELSHADLVAVWAEQAGSAHEDWSHTESFKTIRGMELYVLGHPIENVALLQMARDVHQIARPLITEWLTAEHIEDGEHARRKELGEQSPLRG